MGKRSAVVELFLGDMGSMQRELRPSTQREDQLTMETKLEQIAVKAVNQLPKSVVREIRTPRSVGAGGGRPPPVTRWDGKRSVAEWPKLPRPSSTLPFETCRPLPIMSVVRRRPEVVFRGHHDRLTRTRHRAPSPKYFTPSFKGCALFGFELAIFAIDRSAPLLSLI